MECTNYKPLASLLPYIDRYWYFDSESKTGTDLYPLFVGTGVDLFIHFDSPFLIDDKKLASSHIFCPRHTTQITANESLCFLAIRFRSGSFRHFCPHKFSELNNLFLSVEDIWDQEGKELLEKIHEQVSMNEKIELLNVFFLKQLKLNKKDSRLDGSISYIYEKYDDVSIQQLSKELNLSLRHFERLFKEEFGVGPKQFQIISRFQSTIKDLLFSQYEDYLEVAINNGYYDQSHFIKECKSLSYMLPLEIVNMKGVKAHFYFKKHIEK